MKHLFFGLLALGSLLMAFAAAVQPPAKPATEAWFQFNGGDPYDPQNYTLVSTAPNCPGNAVLCAVRAEKQTGADLPAAESLEAAGQASSDFTIEIENMVQKRAN